MSLWHAIYIISFSIFCLRKRFSLLFSGKCNLNHRRHIFIVSSLLNRLGKDKREIWNEHKYRHWINFHRDMLADVVQKSREEKWVKMKTSIHTLSDINKDIFTIFIFSLAHKFLPNGEQCWNIILSTQYTERTKIFSFAEKNQYHPHSHMSSLCSTLFKQYDAMLFH